MTLGGVSAGHLAAAIKVSFTSVGDMEIFPSTKMVEELGDLAQFCLQMYLEKQKSAEKNSLICYRYQNII
jgi:hypothetical protein